MNYKILRNNLELPATDFIEIGQGKYSAKHWQKGFIFIYEDDFNLIEGIITKHFPEYDHYNMNNIPKKIGVKITFDFFNIVKTIHKVDENEYPNLFNYTLPHKNYFIDEVVVNKNQIVKFLKELSEAIENFYKNEDWICILGI